MSEAIESIFAAWSLPPFLTTAIVLPGLVYLRGWLAIRKTRSAQFTLFRACCFLLGLFILWFAIASPMDGFADVSLSAHMIEHLLLMSAVAPLLVLGYPLVPLLRGFPRWIRRLVLGPLLRLSSLRRLGRWLINPSVAWLAMNVTYLAWHIPAAYDFALRHEFWHDFEHLCFLASSLAFWWSIIRPWPTYQRRNRWEVLVYLVLADLVNTALSAFLAFCNWPVYNYYLTRPNPFQISPLADQMLGAVIMWVGGSLAFLAPAVFITFELLQAPFQQTPGEPSR